MSARLRHDYDYDYDCDCDCDYDYDYDYDYGYDCYCDRDFDYDCDCDCDCDYTYCRGLLPGHSLPFPRPLPSSLACHQVVGNWNRNSWDIGSSLRSGGFVSLFSNSFSSNT